MTKASRMRWKHILPWIVSAGLLFYVFNVATDWDRLRAATEQANLPLFIAFTTADRVAFFVVWALLQAAALRRFVAHVPVHSIIAIRGGSELLRAVSNPLSDGAFFLGLRELTGGKLEAVLAAALVPAICHFLVLALQVTVALPFLPGSFDSNRDVFVAAGVTWVVGLALAIGVRISATGSTRIPGARRVRNQGLASRAFGVEIAWTALAARIPLLYLALVTPSLGNFGTRELAWAGLFSEFGSRDALIAYAFAVNSVFLILNVLIGTLFIKRALELVAEVRRARKAGEPAPAPLLRDPAEG
jgi:hypothetical protein